MPLSLTVDTLDSVPEPLRDHYVEKDGKFQLAVDGIEDTSGLKSALEAERKNAREAAKLAKAYRDLGMSADDIRSLVAEKEEAARQKAEKEGNFDAILKQHQSKWEKEKADLETKLNASLESEKGAVIGTKLMAALTKAGATEEGIDLLPDRLAARIRYEMEDGRRALHILSASGETPMAGSEKDGTASFDDLVKEAVTKWPSLFKGTGAGGGGKPPGSAGGTGKTITRKAFDAMPLADQAASVRSGLRVVD